MPQYTKEQVIQALRQSRGLVYVAAKSLGCTPQTIYNHMKRSEDVRDAIKNERGHSLDIAELALMSAVQKQEGWAVQFMLKMLAKDRGFVERTEQVNFNVDTALIQRAIEAIEKQGLSASDVFEQIIASAAEEDRALVGADGAGEGESASN